MHIPDGYLGPQTYIPLYGVFASFIVVAIRKIRKTLDHKMIPFLGMASAFSFLIMMFNIPLGTTTGHAVGSAIISLVLGPWIAVVSVSVAVILQALIFGDGGITAIGANCFNMAIVMSFTAYGIFKLFSLGTPSIKRFFIAAFASGYISLFISAVFTAIEFGIQPMLSVTPDGRPLNSPFPLSVAIPAMAAGHLLLFGVIEGIATALLFRFFYQHNREIIFVLKPHS